MWFELLVNLKAFPGVHSLDLVVLIVIMLQPCYRDDSLYARPPFSGPLWPRIAPYSQMNSGLGAAALGSL